MRSQQPIRSFIVVGALLASSITHGLQTFGWTHTSTSPYLGRFWSTSATTTLFPAAPTWFHFSWTTGQQTVGGNVWPIASEFCSDSNATLLLNADGLVIGAGRDDTNYGLGGSGGPNLGSLGAACALVTQNLAPIKDAIQIGQAGPTVSTIGVLLRSNGTAMAWGRGFYSTTVGKIGAGVQGAHIDPIRTLDSTTAPILGASGSGRSPIKQVSVGNSVSLLLADGTVETFAGTVFGQNTLDSSYLGRPLTTTFEPGKVVMANGQPLANIKQIASGLVFTLALDSEGRVWSWGDNSQGQLGINKSITQQGLSGNRALPVLWKATNQRLTRVKQIACSQTAGFALMDNGAVVGWGEDGTPGQLAGLGTPVAGQPGTYCLGAVPLVKQTLRRIIRIWTNVWGLYALRDDGVVLGLGAKTQTAMSSFFVSTGFATPTVLPLPNNTNTGVLGGGGGRGGMLYRATGNGVGWGANLQRQLAAASPNTFMAGAVLNLPSQAFGIKFKAYETDAFGIPDEGYSVAIDGNGAVWSVGVEDPQYENLGDGPSSSAQIKSSFTMVPWPSAVSYRPYALCSNYGSTLLLTSGGSLVGFGQNPFADNPGQSTSLPVASLSHTFGPSNSASIIDIAKGSESVFVLLSNGTVWSRGNNTNGILGNGLGAGWHDWKQVRVTANQMLRNVIAIAAQGEGHAMALTADGKVYLWGENLKGQLCATGTAPSNYARNPKPATGLELKDIKAIAVGGPGQSLALRADGRVLAWGSNQFGQLGRLPVGNGPNPVAKFVLDTAGVQLGRIKQIDSGGGFCVALAASGEAYAWGSNKDGRLGIGNGSLFAAKATLVSAPGSSAPLYQIAVGGNAPHAIAIAADN